MPNSITLDDKMYYPNIETVAKYLSNEVVNSAKLVERYQQFYDSSYIETAYCGVRIFALLLFNYNDKNPIFYSD